MRAVDKCGGLRGGAGSIGMKSKVGERDAGNTGVVAMKVVEAENVTEMVGQVENTREE